MNLHGVVKSAIGVVNPFIPAILAHNAGYVTQPDLSRVAAYEYFTARIQVQAVTEDQLTFNTNQGFQGVLRSVYLDGDWSGIIKADQKGNDLLTFGGYDWMITQVLETWSDWSHVIVAQQNMNATALPDVAPLQIQAPLV